MPASPRVLEALRAARAAVTEVLRHPQQAAPHVADALSALDRLERLLESTPAAPTAAATRGRRNQPKVYRVEGRTGQEALCEYRADDPGRPFRCPKRTYDALARVLTALPKLAKFPDIEKRMKKELGEVPALYQLRVALRFWTSPAIELVERTRAQYRAKAPRSFVREAQRLWGKHGR